MFAILLLVAHLRFVLVPRNILLAYSRGHRRLHNFGCRRNSNDNLFAL